jgi:hypothetical protein
MTVEAFQASVKDWIAKAKHPRWDRQYTDLVYQPMLEVMKYFRVNGYKTYSLDRRQVRQADGNPSDDRAETGETKSDHCGYGHAGTDGVHRCLR